jgi:predicted nuclease of predicted toxin-antitoxin system
MRFLVDECAGPALARWLREHDHEVFSVYDQARSVDDDFIIAKAYAENWILITIDKDFGAKIYRDRHPHHGVILMRLDDERVANKISVMQRLLATHADNLADRYIVVTDNHVRFAQND